MAQHPGIMPQGAKRSFPFASPPGMRAEDPESRRPPYLRPPGPMTGGLQPPHMGVAVVTIDMFREYQQQVNANFEHQRGLITTLQERVQAMETQVRSLEEAEDMAIDAVREIRDRVVPRVEKHHESIENLTGAVARQNTIVETLGNLGQEFRATQGRNDAARPSQLAWRPGPLGSTATEQQLKSTVDELKAQLNSSFTALGDQEARLSQLGMTGEETRERVAKLEQRSNHGLIPAHISAIMQHHQQRLQSLEEQLQQQVKAAQDKPLPKSQDRHRGTPGSKQSREQHVSSKKPDQQKSPTETPPVTPNPDQPKREITKPQTATAISASELEQIKRRLDAIDKRMAPLEEKFIPLEQRIAPLEQRIVPLEQRITPLEDRIIPLERSIAPLEQRITPLEQTIAPLEQRIAPLEQMIIPLEKRIAPLEEQIMPLQGRIKPLEERIMPLESRIIPLEERMSPLEGRLNAMEKGLEKVEGSIESLSKMTANTPESEAMDVSPPDQYQILTHTDFQRPEDLSGLRFNEDAQLLMQLFSEKEKCEDACYTVQRACVHMWSYLLCRSRNDPRLISDFWKSDEWGDYPTVLELERTDTMPEGKYFPRYVYEIGEIFNRRIVTKYNGRQATHRSTGYHLVVDITSPKKSLWLVYRYEDVSKDSQSLKSAISYKRDSFWHPFASVGDFDIAQVFESIEDWKGADTTLGSYAASKKLVRQTAALIRPTFIEPILEEVKETIRQGWSNSIEARPLNGDDSTRSRRGRQSTN
ncbi:hypothetical protein F5Y16DRAFT_291884 [Xylariaceae sp. FL0255]|nr:hypothetical protein F5Y16DRAFT_291884 [Xylariaceae sp. FL0255]